MHIGLITTRVSPHAGGAFTFERELLDALSRLSSSCDHQFSIIYRDGRVTDLGGGEIRPRGGHRRAKLKSFAARSMPWLARSWRRQSPGEGVHWLDLYVQQLEIDLAWFLSPAKRPLNVPYFTVVWDLQHRLQPHFPEVSSRGEWQVRESMYAQVLRRASGVIAGTEAGRAEIERFYQVPPERVHILPHPTPSFALRPPEVDDTSVLNHFNLQPGFLLYPAQFWSHKNHAGLLQTLIILRERYQLTPTLVLVGSDQGNRTHVEKLCQRWNLSAQVRFLNFVSREQLIALYRQAACLSYVSFFGPENLPPLEAFALGCPVVASRVSGAEEQLADAAMLADPHCPQEIADAIARVLREPNLRQQLISLGHQRAKRFTGDDFVRGMLQAVDRFQNVRQCWASAG